MATVVGVGPSLPSAPGVWRWATRHLRLHRQNMCPVEVPWTQGHRSANPRGDIEATLSLVLALPLKDEPFRESVTLLETSLAQVLRAWRDPGFPQLLAPGLSPVLSLGSKEPTRGAAASERG